MAAVVEEGGSPKLSAEAFQLLYPEQFHQQFLDVQTRPDGRPLARARPTSCVLCSTLKLCFDKTVGSGEPGCVYKIEFCDCLTIFYYRQMF